MCRAILPLLAFAFRAAAQPPAPLGQLIDVGGYRIHIYCAGQGASTAVIAGGGFSFDWALVQPEVAKFTGICAYDPSGTPWSDPGTQSKDQPDCLGRVEELHKRTAPDSGAPAGTWKLFWTASVR